MRDPRMRIRDSTMRSRDSTMRSRDSTMRCRDSRMRCRDSRMRCRDSRMRCRGSRMRCRDSRMQSRDSTMRSRDSTMRCRDSRIFFSSHYTTPAQCWAQDLARGLNSSRSSSGLHGCGRTGQTSRCFMVCSSPHSHVVCPSPLNPHFCIRDLHRPVPVRRRFRLDQVGHVSLEPGGSDSLGLDESLCGVVWRWLYQRVCLRVRALPSRGSTEWRKLCLDFSLFLAGSCSYGGCRGSFSFLGCDVAILRCKRDVTSHPRIATSPNRFRKESWTWQVLFSAHAQSPRFLAIAIRRCRDSRMRCRDSTMRTAILRCEPRF